MKGLAFEWKKLFRLGGFKNLCNALLTVCFLLVLFGEITPMESQTQAEHIANYDANISYVIRVAERNRLEYAYTSGNDSYIVRYQDDVIGLYSSLVEKGVSPEEVSGWNEYFSFAADDWIPLLFAVMVGVILTMVEYDNRTDTVLKITRYGKRSAEWKIAVFVISAVLFSVLITFVSLLGFGIRFGLSSPFVPLCSVIEFLYCPYDFSIFAYLLISLLIKTANMLALMLFSACIANLFKSYTVSFFGSLCVLAGGYGISLIVTNSSWIHVNPYSLGMTDAVFERYRAVNLFGESVSLSAILSACLVFACLVLCGLFLFGYGRYHESSAISGFEKSVKHFTLKIKDRARSLLGGRKPKRQSLFVSEAKKSFLKSKLIILCVMMLCAKLYYASDSIVPVDEYEQYYREICHELTGELTDEKQVLIQTKLSESEEIISGLEKRRNDFNSGLITSEEYSEYREKCNIAFADQYAYGKLYEQCMRIEKANDNGIKAQFLYDTGWMSFFDAGADIVLYALLLLFFCGTYAMEYNSGFVKIAETTIGGMKALHKAKIMLVFVVTVIAFGIFFMADLLFLINSYPLANAGFPLASVTDGSYAIPLWTAMLLFALRECILSVLLSFIIYMLSRFLKKTYLSFAAGLVIVALLFA